MTSDLPPPVAPPHLVPYWGPAPASVVQAMQALDHACDAWPSGLLSQGAPPPLPRKAALACQMVQHWPSGYRALQDGPFGVGFGFGMAGVLVAVIAVRTLRRIARTRRVRGLTARWHWLPRRVLAILVTCLAALLVGLATHDALRALGIAPFSEAFLMVMLMLAFTTYAWTRDGPEDFDGPSSPAGRRS